MEGCKLYIKRNLERKFLKLNGFFKVMLVTGARQVGKTPMLKHLAEGTNRTYVSMDDLLARVKESVTPPASAASRKRYVSTYEL